MINRESGKMLGTLAALAIARMPNLETFVWDAPTGILRDCWLALSSVSEFKDLCSRGLEKVWVRFHDNVEIIATTEHLPRWPHAFPWPSSTLSDPSQTQWKSAVSIPPTANRLAWSYRHVEFPNFSCLPALKSLSVLDIDELAYLEEMSVLLERSIETLRELRVGLGADVPRKGFASMRVSHQDFADDTSELSTYEGALGLLMSKVNNVRHGNGSACPANRSGKAAADLDHKPYTGNTAHPISHGSSSVGTTLVPSPGPTVAPDPVCTAPPDITSADVLSNLVIGPGRNETSESFQPPVQTPPENLVHGQAKTDLNTSSGITSSSVGLEAKVQQDRRLRLEVLELERVNISVPVMTQTIDWSVVASLTLLHCDSHEQLWKAFRRTYTPQLVSTTPAGSSQAVLRRKSRVSSGNPSVSDPNLIPFSEYRLNLRHLHTNTVSSALIAFLKDTLAPNSLESLFLQDGGLVNSNGAGGRSAYDSIITVDSICRGPLRRHRSSLKRVLIDSGHRSRENAKWRKWKLDRDVLSYVTSGKMSALREFSFSLDFKDWVSVLTDDRP